MKVKNILYFLIFCMFLTACYLFFWNKGEEDYFYYTIGITGVNETNCGMSTSNCKKFNQVMKCATDAFQRKKSFSAYFNINLNTTFALASTSTGKLYVVRPNSENGESKVVSRLCKYPKLVEINQVKRFYCVESEKINTLIQGICK